MGERRVPEVLWGGWHRCSKVGGDDAFEVPVAGYVLNPPQRLHHSQAGLSDSRRAVTARKDHVCLASMKAPYILSRGRPATSHLADY